MPPTKMLPNEAIEEFKLIYFKKFGKQLTPIEAEKYAIELFQLYDAVYGKRITQRS